MIVLISKRQSIAWLSPFLVLLLLFFLVPLLYMLITSFQNSDGFTLAQYKAVFTNGYILQGFKNSITLSVISAIIALMVTLFAVYAMMKFSEPVREKILILTNLTSNFSGIPLAFAFIVLLGNSGLFTLLFEKWDIDALSSFSLYSWGGLLLIYIYFQLPLSLMLLYPIYDGIQQQWKEAAALLGASSWQFWMKIGLPVMLPGIVGTFSVLFANAMGAYASAYALTSSNYNLVAIRIGSLIKGDIFAQPELASAIAVILAVSMVTAMLISEWSISKTRRKLK
ncbi:MULTISPECIES: ABC transporter permease [Lysinibacillus]|uniref:Putative spermidine/putrescine transport system permease protein n=1 Tax=Lysinibacillus fusiformis TaxID=28031 RepID=A0A1H9CVS4_9BACI|nr:MULTISPECIES: ABC transporter permease subunit [Lysinibacillus]EAZ84757.1 ABC transporter permease protein [Bacillus sp. B14905]MCE4043579.1 ABC transporter permease subunit [Lysinibacillus fusiformis]MCG7434317.1 ABC transporter permease subunit [Lysinibacillus fusiformis]MCK1986984.1 ABC transporter permease subunit [Lysinibacillus fusiformis]MCT6928461.1 ABC transporter permease subunit [Lysinibacillus fusiformis]